MASIYAKPAEFYWQVNTIEVLRPIQYATFKRNEVKSKMPRIPAVNPLKACISIEDDRTQRQSVVLRDVRYRITAQIVPRPDFSAPPIQLYNQFERRAKRGQMFVQPVMGTREFPAYFEWGSDGEAPIQEDLDLGLMVYDVFDLNVWKVGKQAEPSVSLYHAKWNRVSSMSHPMLHHWCSNRERGYSMLTELYRYALDKGLSAKPGFKPKRVKAYVLLSADGKFLSLETRDKKLPRCTRPISEPPPTGRGSATR